MVFWRRCFSINFQNPALVPSSICSADGDLEAGAQYADQVANAAERNPWARPGDAQAYREAARRLREMKLNRDGKESSPLGR